MATDSSSHESLSRARWAAQIATLDAPQASRTRKPPITLRRIIDVALGLVESKGFESLTMRRVAAQMETGPASLYAHVRNKSELADLLIGELCTRVKLPVPDAKRWQGQIIDVCRQLREQFLRYPGISAAALAAAPSSLDTLRINEGMLAILLAGGVPAQTAAWAIDAAYLYVCAYSLESSLRRIPGGNVDGRNLDKEEIVERLEMLPRTQFPHTVSHARELTGGEGHERFDFTLGLMFQGLAPAG